MILGVLGFLFGVGLSIASRKFAVKTDHRLETIVGLLPGANCGACGGAGCFGFAEAILSGKMSVDACKVAEEKVKEKIAEVLGEKLEKKVKLVATFHCGGGNKAKDKFLYKGEADCVEANLLFAGQKSCFYGCLGFGNCVKACPFGAIKMSDEGIPVVDEAKCKGCNKCVLICPKKLFTLRPVTHKIHVACASHDLGREAAAACPAGCIACRKCEQICPADAIKLINNLAVIDYKKCTSCGKCVEACPRKCIKKVSDKG